MAIELTRHTSQPEAILYRLTEFLGDVLSLQSRPLSASLSGMHNPGRSWSRQLGNPSKSN